MLAIQSPFPQYYDVDGSPLDAGYVYFGVANDNPETNPITVYWDAAGTQPAAQPLRTKNGVIYRSGKPALVYANSDYSITIKSKFGDLVSYEKSSKDWTASLQIQSNLAASSGLSLIGFIQSGTGAVARTGQDKNREIKSVEDFGAIGDGSLTTAQMYAALSVAWNSALADNHDLLMPAGAYDCGTNNFPFRNPSSASLLDCGGLTIWCQGEKTILKTTSVNGADVLQLNALKNFHLKGFPKITGTISGTASGSNGVSVTNGFDNITLEIYGYNLPSLDKTTYVDGGKALTLQNGTTSNACGLLKATVIADGCVEGFGVDDDLVTSAGKNRSVFVDVIARNCYIGTKYVAAGASGALSTSMTSGIRVRGQSIDCQHGVLVQRAHGIDVDVQVISTKTAAAKRLNPSGVAWIASDTVVEGVQIDYAKNGIIKVHGNAGACDYKAQIGAASAGSSGLNGATQYSQINIDLGGTAAIADLNAINSGGNTMKDSALTVSTVTASSFPSDFGLASNSNRLLLGNKYVGSFTATLTGCTTAPTVSVSYCVEGNQVTLNIPQILATSNATGATLTGMPTNLYPAVNQWPACLVQDNGTTSPGRLLIDTAGLMTLNKLASSIFTNSGTKGLEYSTVTYSRN